MTGHDYRQLAAARAWRRAQLLAHLDQDDNRRRHAWLRRHAARRARRVQPHLHMHVDWKER